MPTLQQWIDCRGLPVDKCNAYRRHRGLPPLSESAPGKTPGYRTGALARIPHPALAEVPVPLPMPSLLQRARNFLTAEQEHRAAGSPMCDDNQLQSRLEICQSCEQFDGWHCRVCGCFCGAGQTYFNKLAWADQSCPHPDGPKWTSLVAGQVA